MTHVVPRFEGDYHFLSNFYENIIVFRKPGTLFPHQPGFTFRTGEAAFQAAKYKAMVSKDPDAIQNYVRAVEAAKTPGAAKGLGRRVKIDPQKWDEIKIDAMREIVFEKFVQSKRLQDLLLGTGHALLVEGNDWGDKFWGRVDGKGYNVLGSLLMEVRGYLYWSVNR